MKVLLGSTVSPQRRFTARWLWEPRDLWIGVFWNWAKDDEGDRYLLIYVSLIPTLPICFAWLRPDQHEYEMPL